MLNLDQVEHDGQHDHGQRLPDLVPVLHQVGPASTASSAPAWPARAAPPAQHRPGQHRQHDRHDRHGQHRQLSTGTGTASTGSACLIWCQSFT